MYPARTRKVSQIGLDPCCALATACSKGEGAEERGGRLGRDFRKKRGRRLSRDVKGERSGKRVGT